MSLRIILSTLMVLIVLSACVSKSAPPAAGQLTDFAKVCDKANEGKLLGVEGYLRWPSSFTGDRTVIMRLFSTADASGKPIGVQIPIGKEPNQLEMPPKQYTNRDMKVHTAIGEVVGVETKVKVSGKVYFPLAGQDFTCALENPFVEKAAPAQQP